MLGRRVTHAEKFWVGGMMWLSQAEPRAGTLTKRMSKNQTALWVLAVIVIVIFFILLAAYTFARLRQRRSAPSQDKLPSLLSWRPWRQRPRRHEYSTSLQENELGSGDHRLSRDREMSGAGDIERQTHAAGAGVDRNTSIRSVMTLPAYAPTARENERILAREGERGGIDTVVEFPETNDEEEERREGEMESLYQIRLARRAEAREREERRQARREARARGDVEALAAIRRQAERAAEESVSQILIAEHQSADRDRRVSSVQYGDLGLARHDGTRLRANSSESNRPLLDSAASIQSGRSRAVSNNTLASHHRGHSATSVVSISPRGSDEFDFADAQRTRSMDNIEDFEVVNLSQAQSRDTSRVASQSSDTTDIPVEDAPAYEDPPNYESPVSTRAPRLPAIGRLPSIHVTSESGHADAGPQQPPS